MHELVRPASGADVPVIAELEQAARDAVADARGGAALLAEEPPVADWAAMITDPGHRVFVAAIDEVVVGYLLLELSSRVPTAYVRQVFVDPGARELGFGDDLLAAAMAAAQEAGATTIESFALPGDRDTKNLFERAGVTARKLIVSRQLDDDRT